MKDALQAFLAVAMSAAFLALPEKWQSALWSITWDIYFPILFWVAILVPLAMVLKRLGKL